MKAKSKADKEFDATIDRYLDGLLSSEEAENFELLCMQEEALFQRFEQRKRFRHDVARVIKEKGDEIFPKQTPEEAERDREIVRAAILGQEHTPNVEAKDRDLEWKDRLAVMFKQISADFNRAFPNPASLALAKSEGGAFEVKTIQSDDKSLSLHVTSAVFADDALKLLFSIKKGDPTPFTGSLCIYKTANGKRDLIEKVRLEDDPDFLSAGIAKEIIIKKDELGEFEFELCD